MSLPIPQLRDAIRLTYLNQPWMGPVSQDFADSLLWFTDLDAALYREILIARNPDTAPDDALALMADDRRIFRGPSEAADSVRQRIKLWIDLWQLAGLPMGFLLAIQAYLAPYYPKVRIYTRARVDSQSICYTLAAGAVPRMLELPGYEPLPLAPGDDYTPAERLRWSGLFTRERVDFAFAWDYTSNPENADRWWHFWTVIYPPWSSPWLWNSGQLYDQKEVSWGTNKAWGNLQTLRKIVRGSTPMNSRCLCTILVPNDGDLDPVNYPTGFPDGRWGWSIVEDSPGIITSPRDMNYRYFDTRPKE